MDEAKLLQTVLRGVLGGRRKRGGRALRHLMGGSSGGGSLWTNPQVLLAAAGVAWGLVETVTGQGGQPGAQGAPSAPASDPLPPLPNVSTAASPPPSDALRMVRLAVSAAQADGALGEAERALLQRIADEQGLGDAVARELGQAAPLADIVAGVEGEAKRRTLYALGFAVVRADEQVSGAERIYLAQLANRLGLDPAAAAKVEATTAASIDAATE